MKPPAGNQRWTEGHASFRPPEERFNAAGHEVAPISRRVAKAFVELHHYSGTCTSQRYQYGLFDHGNLVGVAVFAQPSNNAAITNWFPTMHYLEVVELGRFVLLEEVKGMGETWFLARCFERLQLVEAPKKWDPSRKWLGIRGVLSFSDPLPRRNRFGEVAFIGHLGTIYSAHNGLYLGRGTARTLKVYDTADGKRVLNFNDRTASKIRTKDSRWRYAAEQLLGAGAPPLPSGDPSKDELRAWLEESLSRITRPVRHQGNHRYAWILDHKRDRNIWKAVGARSRMIWEQLERAGDPTLPILPNGRAARAPKIRDAA